MLSERDQELFQGLFETMGVRHLIRYSTINDCVEWLLEANAFPDVGKATKAYLSGGRQAAALECPAKGQKLANSLLLVDEVDVLFGESFYGQSMAVAEPIEESHALMRRIWKERDQWRHEKETKDYAWKIQELKQLDECKDLLKALPNLDRPGTNRQGASATLLDIILRQALEDVLHFDGQGNYSGPAPDYKFDPVRKEIGYFNEVSNGMIEDNCAKCAPVFISCILYMLYLILKTGIS